MSGMVLVSTTFTSMVIAATGSQQLAALFNISIESYN
jgi:hypothetical protein